MVRVGLIGFGMAGQAFHAPVIRGVPGMELACILERRRTRAQEKYPGVRVARTLGFGIRAVQGGVQTFPILHDLLTFFLLVPEVGIGDQVLDLS